MYPWLWFSTQYLHLLLLLEYSMCVCCACVLCCMIFTMEGKHSMHFHHITEEKRALEYKIAAVEKEIVYVQEKIERAERNTDIPNGMSQGMHDCFTLC